MNYEFINIVTGCLLLKSELIMSIYYINIELESEKSLVINF